MKAMEHGVGVSLHAETQYLQQQPILQVKLLPSNCITLQVVRRNPINPKVRDQTDINKTKDGSRPFLLQTMFELYTKIVTRPCTQQGGALHTYQHLPTIKMLSSHYAQASRT